MINELKICKFNSLEEFITYADSCPLGRIRFDEWSGAGSYVEAKKIVREGIELGRVEKQLKKLEHSRPAMVQVVDVAGSVVNMDAYLTGEPENMFEFPIVEEPTKFLNLFIDAAESSFKGASELVNKAIAIASIVDELENNGYRIAISVGDIGALNKTFSGKEADYTTALATNVRIKDYHQPISIGQLTGCCHPIFLRGFIFAHYYEIYKNVGGPPSGKGKPMTNKADLEKVLKAMVEPNTVLIPSSAIAGEFSGHQVRGDLSTVESAINFVSYFIKAKL